MSGEAIAITSLDKSFSNETVLRDIDLTVEEGEFCVVVGPSGCGKSTLLQCVSGLVEHDADRIALNGDDVASLSVPDRNLGYVFQEFEDTLFPHMTVGENIAFGLRQQDTEYDEADIDRRIDEMLELLAIADTRDDYPSELSGGQQQRVEIARQLVRECDVMLLDDPLADLDYKLQKRMELEIRDLHEDLDSTFLYVTHNQDQALKLADRLVVMNDGTIEQTGTPREIYRSPKTAFVGRFVGDSNAFRGRVTEVESETVTLETPFGRQRARVPHGEPTVDGESLFLFRPEEVTVGAGAEAKDNTVTTELVGRTYTGEETELTFRHDDTDHTFQVTVPNEADIAAGADDVPIGWDTSDALYFPELSVASSTTIDDLIRI